MNTRQIPQPQYLANVAPTNRRASAARVRGRRQKYVVLLFINVIINFIIDQLSRLVTLVVLLLMTTLLTMILFM